VQLDNNGRMAHRTWDLIDCTDETVDLVERLDWITQADEHWIAESRRMAVSAVNAAAGTWMLDIACRLTNVRGEPLIFGSPTTEGRPLAGYGGLFWRGPRSFRGGEARAEGGLDGDEIMGERAAWLAYSGLHDGSGDRSTLLFLDHPANLRYPTQWFMRRDPFACASFAFSFDEEYTLPPDETIAQNYRIVIADGALTAEQIDCPARLIILRTLKKRSENPIYRAVPVPTALIGQLESTHGLNTKRGGPSCNRSKLWDWKSRTTAWAHVKKVIGQAGIGPGPHATAKGLRHGFAIAAIEKGVPLNMIRKWMGHACIETTAIYANASGEEERKLAARLWS